MVEYTRQLLEKDGAAKTEEQSAIQQCLIAIFDGKSDTEIIKIAGDLIAYTRDHALPALGGIRRTAAVTAREHLSPGQIAQDTGLSKVAVSRLITEFRNLDSV